jgi:hypothetical protein
LPSATILVLASFALSRAGVAPLVPESVRLVALLPSPAILLIATHSLRRAILARLPLTSTEFLAFASCTRLILIGLLKGSVVLHDHNNAAYPIPPQAGHSG